MPNPDEYGNIIDEKVCTVLWRPLRTVGRVVLLTIRTILLSAYLKVTALVSGGNCWKKRERNGEAPLSGRAPDGLSL